ncbi:MAG: hypothetical protein WAL56_05690 [Candidatus Sulfotelmatobacter sp.]
MKSRIAFSGVIAGAVVLLASLAWAAPRDSKPTAQAVSAFPGSLVNATYVYVTSYDGDEFNVNLLPEDRKAIVTVQNAMQKWGKFTLVYEPRQADIVLMVTSRPSEDILAVYDAHGWPRNQYLWRMMGAGGLQRGEAPLVSNLETAFTLATTHHDH